MAAVNTGGASALSNEANATPQVSAPAAPTGLKATAGNAQVTLNWTASSGAASYNVYRGGAAAGEATAPIATGITATTFVNTGLTNGSPYFYKVAAVNTGGTSALSNEANATPQVSAPAAPTGLKATAGNAQVTLNWTASSGAASYNVYRGGAAAGEATAPIATGITATTFVNTGLTNGSPYFYKVAAVNTGGTSALSNEANATPQASAPTLPAAPTGLTATAGNAQVTLNWTASSGATSYNVYRGGAASGEATAPIATGITATTFINTGLTNGSPYFYKVAAVNAGGASALSNEANATPQTGAPPVGLHFVPVKPCRVVDTRSANGPFGGPALAAGTARSFAIPQSNCGIPDTATAYSLNVTVIPHGGRLGYLTLWPTGQPQPVASTLNSWRGFVLANAAIVQAGTNGAVSAYVTDNSDIILDINGYFDTSSGTGSYAFYPAAPCRFADTRNPAGQFGGPTPGGGQGRPFPVPQSSCNVPASATAYSLNVTVAPDGALGYLTLWPTGQDQPLVSTLNSMAGTVVANAAIVPAGTNGSISAYVTDPADVILDINGYFAAPGNPGALSFYPVTPCRVADTRNADGPFGGPELEGGTTRSFAVTQSVCNIPATAAAYAMNVTVVPDGPLAYLTAWPAGSNQPLVSTLNSGDGSVVANAAIVPAGANGAISFYVTDDTHVILDINGYFAP